MWFGRQIKSQNANVPSLSAIAENLRGKGNYFSQPDTSRFKNKPPNNRQLLEQKRSLSWEEKALPLHKPLSVMFLVLFLVLTPYAATVSAAGTFSSTNYFAIPEYNSRINFADEAPIKVQTLETAHGISAAYT